MPADDHPEWTDEKRPVPGAPAQWGLACTLSGIAVGLAFPIVLLLFAAGAAFYYLSPAWPREGLAVMTRITAVAIVGLILLSFLILGEGIYALVLARRRKEPIGLAWSGLCGGVVAVFFSTLLAISAWFIADAMWQEQDRREREPQRPPVLKRPAAW